MWFKICYKHISSPLQHYYDTLYLVDFLHSFKFPVLPPFPPYVALVIKTFWWHLLNTSLNDPSLKQVAGTVKCKGR
jgi:hypothetical protein